MKKRGVKNAFVMDLKRLNFPDNYFDSILMMFNNFGLAGSVEATKKLLKTLNKISTPKGRIIAAIRDPYKTDDPQHLAYHKKNRKAGKPIGQVKIRIEYNGEVGDWFFLLMVSVEELKDLIKNTGWRILKIIKGDDGNYGAVLKKLKF
jgi:ubiquinone/menaquinone biosynthesis C-methylase UbiE